MRPPGRPRIEIDEEILRSGTATAIAKATGHSIDTILARQREAGVEIRPQGHRDWHPVLVPGFPASHWINGE
jgi:hypothetical protein